MSLNLLKAIKIKNSFGEQKVLNICEKQLKRKRLNYDKQLLI